MGLLNFIIILLIFFHFWVCWQLWLNRFSLQWNLFIFDYLWRLFLIRCHNYFLLFSKLNNFFFHKRGLLNFLFFHIYQILFSWFIGYNWKINIWYFLTNNILLINLILLTIKVKYLFINLLFVINIIYRNWLSWT